MVCFKRQMLNRFGISRSWLLLTGLFGAAGLSPLASQEVPSVTPTRIFTVKSNAVTDNYIPDRAVTLKMLQKVAMAWSGSDEADPSLVWKKFLQPDDVIGIQVFSSPGPMVGSSPILVECLIQEILAAGFQSEQLVIWDRFESDLKHAGFGDLARRYGVRLAGARDVGYDPQVYYESSLPGRLIWGDLDFGKDKDPSSLNEAKRSYVSKLLTQQITRIIQVMPLMNHNSAEISGNLLNLAFSSCDNMIRFEGERDMIEVAVPEILGLQVPPDLIRLSAADQAKFKEIGFVRPLADRIALCITDALICQYRGEKRAFLHYSTTLNEIWIGSDPVAMDVHGVETIHRERYFASLPKETVDRNKITSGWTEPRWRLFTNATLLQLGQWNPDEQEIVQVDF